MNILIDTNVILDVLLHREPFFEKSQLIILAVEENFINGFVSASAITDIFYISAKLLKDKNTARDLIKRHLVGALHIATVDDGIIKQALNIEWDDFEDCIQYCVGESINADYIITRNPKDFISKKIPALTPEEFFKKKHNR